MTKDHEEGGVIRMSEESLRCEDTCTNCCGEGCELCISESEEENSDMELDQDENQSESEDPQEQHKITSHEEYIGAQPITPTAEKQPITCPGAPKKRRKQEHPIRYQGPDMMTAFFELNEIPLERAIRIAQAWIGYNKLIIKEQKEKDNKKK